MALGVAVAARVGEAATVGDAAVVVVGDALRVVVAVVVAAGVVMAGVTADSLVGVAAFVADVAVGSASSSEPPIEHPLRSRARATDMVAPRRSARPARLVR